MCDCMKPIHSHICYINEKDDDDDTPRRIQYEGVPYLTNTMINIPPGESAALNDDTRCG